MRRFRNGSITGTVYTKGNKIKQSENERGSIMFKQYLVTFLLVIVSIVVLTGCAAVLPESGELSETEAVALPVNIPQDSDPMLVVPESTMGEATERYVQNWDDNPVATIPESMMAKGSEQYIPNWDDNPVATIPESTMGAGSGQYIPNWDDNPVATIPESTMSKQPHLYIHNWDDNPVATIPESTMGK